MGIRFIPSCSNGASSSSGAPGQPSQAPCRRCITGAIAVTSPPGLLRHEAVPSCSTTRSTGNRFATIRNVLRPTTQFLLGSLSYEARRAPHSSRRRVRPRMGNDRGDTGIGPDEPGLVGPGAEPLSEPAGPIYLRELADDERRRTNLAQDLRKQTRIAHSAQEYQEAVTAERPQPSPRYRHIRQDHPRAGVAELSPGWPARERPVRGRRAERRALDGADVRVALRRQRVHAVGQFLERAG